MKVLLLAVLATMALVGVSARGRVFNRFSPETLANLGYGGHGGMHRTQPFFEVRKKGVNLDGQSISLAFFSNFPRTTWLKTNPTRWNASRATGTSARPMITVVPERSAIGTALTGVDVSLFEDDAWARFVVGMRTVNPDLFAHWQREVWSEFAACPSPCRSNTTRSATRPRTATLREVFVVSCRDGIVRRIERWVRISCCWTLTWWNWKGKRKLVSFCSFVHFLLSRRVRTSRIRWYALGTLQLTRYVARCTLAEPRND